MRKDKGMFNMPHRRGSDCVKLVFSAYELSCKPIRYWNNVGNIHKHSNFKMIEKTVKQIVGDSYGNNVSHLAYYGGSRLLFPFHLNWLGTSWELTIYDPFGMPGLTLKGSGNHNTRFTKSEIAQIEMFMQTTYHIIWDAYRLISPKLDNPKGHVQVREQLKEIIK